jgi:hypothetical protein
MPELNKSDGNVLTAADTDDIDEQMIVTCTSSTRPAGVDGRVIYETDTGKYMSYNSTAAAWSVLGGSRWVTFTPSWTNLTVGNGTNTGAYRYADGGMLVAFDFTFGSTSSMSGNLVLNVPNSETTASGPPSIGITDLTDTGTRSYIGHVSSGGSSTTMGFTHTESGNTGLVNATNPFTWATGDRIFGFILLRL